MDILRIFIPRLAVTIIFPTCKNTWIWTRAGWKSCIIIPQYNLSEKFDTSAWKTNRNKRNIKEKKIRNMYQNAFFPCLQRIIMRKSKREEQKTNVWSAKRYNSQRKKIFTALFKIC